MTPRSIGPDLDQGPHAGADTSAIRRRMAASHQDFVRLVHARVGSRTIAEGVLRDAFSGGPDSANDDESAVTWFLRNLRTAVQAYQGRHEVTTRGLTAFAEELAEASAGSLEIRRAIVETVSRLIADLDPVYATALQRVEIDGVTVREYARESGIQHPNTLVVRLFRAREALKKQVVLACMHCAE